eukprot:Skav224920  [mRNA]  locus=scaffold1966:78903:82867:+ [translate_table: standard]
MGQHILGKEISSWHLGRSERRNRRNLKNLQQQIVPRFGPTSAAQAVGHLFERSKDGSTVRPDFLKEDGPIYKESVMERFNSGYKSVILLVCRRLGLESCNLEEYQQGLDICFRLPEFQGLASGNSSSSAHFFVATHGEDSLLFMDPHVTHPALQKEADVVASCGLRAGRPLRLPWTSLNPSICVAFLVQSKGEFLSLCDRLCEGPGEQLFEVLEREPTYNAAAFDDLLEADDLAPWSCKGCTWSS